MIIVIVDKII